MLYIDYISKFSVEISNQEIMKPICENLQPAFRVRVLDSFFPCVYRIIYKNSEKTSAEESGY